MPLHEHHDSPLQKSIEKMMQYRYGDNERARSNRAAGLADAARGTRRTCPTNPKHLKFAYSGPPHDLIRAYVCIYCGATACEPEIKDRGYDFETCPDWIMLDIMDLDLQRQAENNTKFFPGLGGVFDAQPPA